MTNTEQDLNAVLHWRGKHAAALKQRDELRQQLADVTDERDLLSKGIADAACKLGITSEGVALTGPHLLMLLGYMVGMVEGLQARSAELERVMRDIRGANAAYALSKIDAALAQSAPAADEHCTTCSSQNGSNYCDCGDD